MGQIVFQATLGGQTALVGQNTASSYSLTLPLATDTLVGKATTDTLTNKTLTSPTINGGTSTATQNLANVTGTLVVGNGGTGLTTLTAGYIPYGNGTSALGSSANLTFSGSTLSVGGTTSVLNLTGSSYSQVISATSLYIDAGSTGAVYIRPNGSTQSAVFSATGYLGIGTTSPNRLLTVQATGTGNVANFQSNAGPNIAFTGTETSGRTYLLGEGLVTAGNFSIYDLTGSVERFVVNSSGNVGVGTSSPSYPLDVVGTINSTASTATGYNLVFRTAGITTGRAQTALTNTSGSFYTGIEGSTAGQTLSGSAAYSSFIGNFAANPLYLVTNGTIQTTLDASGNLGLGVTPSTWSQGKAFEFFNSGYGLWNGGSSTYVTANMYFNGGFKYANTGSQASNYYQYQGQHVWNIAPSGTAGGTITFTQAMTLDNSGNLLVGTTSAANGTTDVITGYRTQSAVTQLVVSNQSSNVSAATGLSLQSYGGSWYLKVPSSTTYVNPLTFSFGSTEMMRLDSSGNLGLGVTPSAWSGAKVLDIGSRGSLVDWASSQQTDIWSNGYFNGTSSIYKTTATASIYRQAVGQHQWFNAPSGTAGNAITFTQAMTLDASGNLGIGTSSPNIAGVSKAVTLNTTNGTSGAIYEIGINGTNYAYLFANASNTVLSSVQSLPLLFNTGNTERMRIDSSGNLLVGGTTSLSSKVAVFQDLGGVGDAISIRDTGSSYGTGAVYIKFQNNAGSTAGSIQHTASTVVVYNATSDERLKENITDAPLALDKVMDIPVRSYDWKEDKHHVEYGFIAQELEKVYVEPVSVGGDSEKNNPWGVEYGRLTPILVKAIQEQQTLINNLTTRLNALEGK